MNAGPGCFTLLLASLQRGANSPVVCENRLNFRPVWKEIVIPRGNPVCAVIPGFRPSRLHHYLAGTALFLDILQRGFTEWNSQIPCPFEVRLDDF